MVNQYYPPLAQFLRRLPLFLGVLWLSACADLVQQFTPVPQEDRQKFLESAKGPQVGSIEDTLKKSAEKAEEQGDYKRAGQFYAQLYDKHPDKIDYEIGLAESLRRTGEYASALKTYDDIIAKAPNNAMAHEGKGLTLMSQGEFVDAGKVFEKALSLDSARWRTLNAVGILFANKNMTEEALAYYEQALKVSRDNASVLNNVGLTLAADKQYDSGIEAFNRALKALPSEGRERKHVELNQAVVYAASGKLEDAKQIASKYYEGPELYNNLGLYAHLAKDDTLARSYLNMALTDSKTFYSKAWNNLEVINGQGKNGGKDTSVRVKVDKSIGSGAAPEAAKPMEAPQKPEPKKEDKKSKEKDEGKNKSVNAAPVKEDAKSTSPTPVTGQEKKGEGVKIEEGNEAGSLLDQSLLNPSKDKNTLPTKTDSKN